MADIAASVRRRAGARPRILFLPAFFPGNAGFEERANSWAKILEAAGFRTRVSWCLPRDRFWGLLVAGRVGEFQLAFMTRRLWHCLQALFFDGVIVQRELLVFNDYGGTFGERFLLALNKSAALDIDDDIAAAKGEPRAIGGFGRLLLESGSKFRESLRLYPRFIVGSSYLEELVRTTRQDSKPGEIAIVPTCIDMSAYPRKHYDSAAASHAISFGWIGSVGNLQYLDLVVPALDALAKDCPVKLIVISGQDYRTAARFEVENVPWTHASQGASLQRIDIGLMPLLDTAAERGKCGFKLLQYMACGIVSVASAVTTNAEIVTDGEDGFLVRAGGDWEEGMRRAIRERHRFPEIGARAVARVEARYTFDANREAYLRFCRDLCGREATTP